MTAILCLIDKNRYQKYDAMVPVTFNSNDPEHINPRAKLCKDAVQAGPRIIEESAKPGITKAELDNPPSQRVVFIVDEPKRRTGLARSRKSARNGYLLITHNPVNLYDLQSMLLDRAFYDGGDPHWAVNLAGANLSGMFVNTGSKPLLIGSTLAVVGSVIVVERRAD
jgi:hypothetical protein